jgi:hypothetical protein
MTVEGAGYTKARGGMRTFWGVFLVIGVVLVVGTIVVGKYYGAIIGLGIIGRSVFMLYGGSDKGPDPSKSGIDRMCD